MRAVVVTAPNALQILEVDRPEPGPDVLRIRVDAAAINPVDGQTVAGMFRQLG